jgi:hypothetical protein
MQRFQCVLHINVPNRSDIEGGRDNSVTENCGSVPDKGKRFISFPHLIARLLGNQSLNGQGKGLPREENGRV